MTTSLRAEKPPSKLRTPDSGPHVGQLAFGFLVVMLGIGAIADQAGWSVPWHLFPSAALIVTGLALLTTLAGGRGRGLLIGLGIGCLIAALCVGLGVGRYAGVAGDRIIAPNSSEWPISAQISAGNVIVDLTRHPLPRTGQLQVNVGAGNLVVVIPKDANVSLDVKVTAGEVIVDGQQVGNGIDVRWSDPSRGNAPVIAKLKVAMGNVTVRHE
jgi:hypothetical protein